MKHMIALAGLGEDVVRLCVVEKIDSVQTMDMMEGTGDFSVVFPADEEALHLLRLVRFVVGLAFEGESAEILDLCEILSNAGVERIDALPTKIDSLANCPRAFKALLRSKFQTFETPPTGPRPPSTLSSGYDDHESDEEQAKGWGGVGMSHGSRDSLVKHGDLKVGGRVLAAVARLAAYSFLKVGDPFADYEIGQSRGFDKKWEQLMKRGYARSPTKRKSRPYSHNWSRF
jgi:hypothetical protein